MLVLDRKGPGGTPRMRVAIAPPGTTDSDPFRGIEVGPTPPVPTTLRSEMQAKRTRLPIDELTNVVLNYLQDRYGDCLEVNERELRSRLHTYLATKSGSGWAAVQRLGDEFATSLIQ